MAKATDSRVYKYVAGSPGKHQMADSRALLPWGTVRVHTPAGDRIVHAVSEAKAKGGSAAVREAVARREGAVSTAPFTGTSVWASSIVLAQVLNSAVASSWWPGQRVIELGAGVGVPGMVAAVLGCREAVLTDQYTHLLEANLAANFSGAERGTVRAARLTWGESSEIAAVSPPFDLILCSDVMVPWFESTWRDLCDTIAALSHSSTVVIWAFERRDAGNDCELFHFMRQLGFTEVCDLSTDPAILAGLHPSIRGEMRRRVPADACGAPDSTTRLPMGGALRAALSDGISLFCLSQTPRAAHAVWAIGGAGARRHKL